MEVNPHLSIKAQHDAELVEQALKGDQKAYGELMSRYRDVIYFTLLKMVKNSSDAEDLTIEALGKAFKHLHQYTTAYAFSTWLFKIATNNAIDFLRKKKLNQVSIEASEEEEGRTPLAIKSDQMSPEESVIHDQKVKMLRSVVAKLHPRYRRLVELRYFYEYSYEEIRDELGLPLGTVKAQLFRARELLYSTLKRDQLLNIE